VSWGREVQKKKRRKNPLTGEKVQGYKKKGEVRAGLYPLGLEPRDTTPHAGEVKTHPTWRQIPRIMVVGG
jgi:hypothetical protein